MEDFREFLVKGGIKDATVDIHVRLIKKFGDVTEDIKEMIKQIKTEPTLSKQRTLAGSVSKYYQYKDWDNKPLLKLMNDINELYAKELAKKNKEMNEDTTLPTIPELKERMKMLFETGEFRAYCIMYLMLTYQTRNMDMVADIVDDLKQTDKENNWFVKREKSVLWIRNKYKTAFSYGQKKHTITNKRFIEAMDTLEDTFIGEDENLFTVIKKATGGITEIMLTKIFMRDANSMNAVRKVAKNRGTSSALLVSNYNIT